MKRYLTYFLILFLIFGFTSGSSTYRSIPNSSFTTGERLTYRVHYGFINAATAEMIIEDRLHYLSGRPCYKVDVYGKTVGFFDLFGKVNDNWGSYIDTAAIIPHRSYRNIEEGSYRKFEVVNFDHKNDNAEFILLDKHTRKPKEVKEFSVPNNVQDIVSGYYFLRTVNYDNLKPGEIISIDAFFDEEIYDFKVRFLRREKLKTKVGNINSVIIAPIMPENELFNGENSLQVWISDDKNKIPLKIKASLFVGALEIDIESYQNTRN